MRGLGNQNLIMENTAKRGNLYHENSKLNFVDPKKASFACIPTGLR